MRRSRRSRNGSRRARPTLARTFRKAPARTSGYRQSAAWISKPAVSGGPSSRCRRSRSPILRTPRSPRAGSARRSTGSSSPAWNRKSFDRRRRRIGPRSSQRASLDLTGLRPSYEEVEAFVADRDPRAYEKLIDRLLASPHYGERWGRYWLDVARYGEDNPTSEATNPGLPVCLAISRLGHRVHQQGSAVRQVRQAATGCRRRCPGRRAATFAHWAISAPPRFTIRICGYPKRSRRRSSPMPGTSGWTPFRAACSA